MGQYYRPVIIGSRGGIKWLRCYDYKNGAKLMEHSWLTNNFVNAVLTQILHHPAKVAWVGDYSDEPWEGNEPYQKLAHDKFMAIYNAVWADDAADKRKIRPEPLSMFDTIGSFSGWYLVNHTQKIYIDLKAYAELNKVHGSYVDSIVSNKPIEYDECINPLPLLTACGNGRGGGDYYHTFPDYTKVGMWAFDKIEFTAFKPEKYTEVSYRFTERKEE